MGKEFRPCPNYEPGEKTRPDETCDSCMYFDGRGCSLLASLSIPRDMEAGKITTLRELALKRLRRVFPGEYDNGVQTLWLRVLMGIDDNTRLAEIERYVRNRADAYRERALKGVGRPAQVQGLYDASMDAIGIIEGMAPCQLHGHFEGLKCPQCWAEHCAVNAKEII